MQFGIMRVRLRQTAKMVLTEEQLNLAQRTHEILAELTVDVNKPENFDLNFDVSGKINVAFYSTPLASATDFSASDKISINPTDPFLELQVNPAKSSICCLFLIIKLPRKLFV